MFQELHRLFEQIEGPTLIEVAIPKAGGNKNYYVVHNIEDLTAIMDDSPPSARVRVASVSNVSFGEPFYLPPGKDSY